jgi:cellulose synthase/poly-beta-1,6-N-acetylglucosamine synthase-like glycosyltransferase
MRTNDYIRIPAGAGSSAPTNVASFTWMMVLAIAVISATFALSCVTPFAALAVVLAGTVGLRASLRGMLAVWFVNQLIGFVFFHFPHTLNACLWGGAIGSAAFGTTIVAAVIMKYGGFWTWPLRIAIGLGLSFVVYEMVLLAAAIFLGGLETFAPAIVSQVALVNIIALAGMMVLNEIVAVLLTPFLGRMPRLARSS